MLISGFPSNSSWLANLGATPMRQSSPPSITPSKRIYIIYPHTYIDIHIHANKKMYLWPQHLVPLPGVAVIFIGCQCTAGTLTSSKHYLQLHVITLIHLIVTRIRIERAYIYIYSESVLTLPSSASHEESAGKLEINRFFHIFVSVHV